MDIFSYNAPQHLQAYVTSLAIGLLIGLERERRAGTKAGLRTFALVAMLGTLSAMIGDKTGNIWMLGLGFATVGAMMIVSVARNPSEDGDPGTTSVVALMICYALGAAVWLGYESLAVMLAVATTALLYFKTELHGFSQSLTSKDLISVLQFAVLSFVILPILPDQDYGPYHAFNPHQIWWMVVIISGVSLAGYAALRLVGERNGATVIGLFGGLVSSTATTMVFSRKARADSNAVSTAAVVVMIANLVVLLRLALLAVLIAPTILPSLAIVLGIGFLCGLCVTLMSWRVIHADGPLAMPEIGNPTEIRTALSFGIVYAMVLFFAAWLQDIAGNKGVYAVSLISGLTDVDAITLTSLRLFKLLKLAEGQTLLAIGLALLSNLLFKSGLILFVGGKTLARRALPGLAAVAVGLVGALIFLA